MRGRSIVGLPVVVLGLAAALAAPAASAARIKCWTNSEGIRECGNFVPPEYAQKGHEEMNRQGLTIRERARAKTQEEIAQEKAETERIAREEEERKRVAREQRERDRVLLYTFTTEEDLVLTRDGKLGAIDSQIKHTEQVIARLEENLRELHQEAAKLERGGKTVPQKLRTDISAVEQRISESLSSISLRHKEKDELAAKFDEDLERYRELKSSRR